MKKYTVARPQVTTHIQWDGTNVSEFEAMTVGEWVWLNWSTPTYVVNGTDLEVWINGNLEATVPVNHWFNSPYDIRETLEGDTYIQVISGNGPWSYSVTDDDA